jgi:F0F1-type ATP synthase membrane subunit b/b'
LTRSGGDDIISRLFIAESACSFGEFDSGNNRKQSGAGPQDVSPTMEIIHQLGELFLEAVPTVVIVLLFYFFLSWAFFQPVLRAMAEREARIEGARAEAAAVEAAAKEELDIYNEALRKARVEIYGEQEAARQAALDERAKLLKSLRSRAQEEVDSAKRRIAAELASALAEVELQTPALANNIARIILEGPSPSRGGAAR